MIVICDIDGCLFDPRELIQKYASEEEIACPKCEGGYITNFPITRPCSYCKGLGKIKKRKWNWKTYFEHTLEMPGILSIQILVKDLILTGHTVYFLTGRPESNREFTIKQLQSNVVYHIGDTQLVMRQNGNTAQTIEQKLDFYKAKKPDLIIEDEPRVVKAATLLGFTVLQVHGYRITEEDDVPDGY